MKRGYLSDYFEAVGVKKLAAVDADPEVSNQHEVTGSKPLARILGDQDRKLEKEGKDNRFAATYVWLGGEQEGISEQGVLSWYDSRRNDKTRSAEWRLYYQTNPVTELMKPGDVLFLAKRPDGSLLFIVTPEDSAVFNQLIWLFGIEDQPEFEFVVYDVDSDRSAEVDFAVRYILDELGIEPEEPDADWLDSLLEKFGSRFPTTAVFSKFAQDTLADVSPVEEPDKTLLMWMEHEQKLFRRLERHIVDDRLREGFVSGDDTDVDGFLKFSLSVQNRRKSRAGLALENHLEAIFSAHAIRYNRGVVTEQKSKPDFLFPGALEYHDRDFPENRLTMLGAKSTCKDRWRQVLVEAARISTKHLLTLEPGISTAQTDEMQSKDLQLVVPAGLYGTYLPIQREWLMNFSDFIELVRGRQEDK